MKNLTLRFALRIAQLLAVTLSFGAVAVTPSPSSPWRTQTTETASDTVAKVTQKSSLLATNASDKRDAATNAKAFRKKQLPVPKGDHLIWVYDAWIELLSDRDSDGYYRSFELGFDVDTNLQYADVFAVVYLGDDEFYREVHTTSVFSIYSDDSDDEFSFSTELLQGFAPDDYDVLIEIYDANTAELQDLYGHDNDPDLSLVSLESNEYEQNGYSAPLPVVVATREHGGSMGMVFVLGIAALIMFRRGY